MRRFQFRLESVLDWRTVELDLEKSKLEQVFAERRRLDEQARALEDRHRETSQWITAKTLDGQQLAAVTYHRHYLEREAARLAGQQADCEKRIAAQQKRVVEAERKVRLLERLKERRLAEWAFDFNRDLEALASETFLAKWAREKT